MGFPMIFMFQSPPTSQYSHHIPIETTIESPLNPIKSPVKHPCFEPPTSFSHGIVPARPIPATGDDGPASARRRRSLAFSMAMSAWTGTSGAVNPAMVNVKINPMNNPKNNGLYIQ